MYRKMQARRGDINEKKKMWQTMPNHTVYRRNINMNHNLEHQIPCQKTVSAEVSRTNKRVRNIFFLLVECY